MVNEPSDYSWSSYAMNALGVESDLQTPHPEYLALGKTKAERLTGYRELFRAHVYAALLEEIRASVNKGLALGSERFTTQIEAMTKKRVTPRKSGRPKKSSNVKISLCSPLFIFQHKVKTFAFQANRFISNDIHTKWIIAMAVIQFITLNTTLFG